MVVIGVYKRYNHSTKSKNHPRAKKHWYAFFYNALLGFYTKRISIFMVPYYKIQVKKKIRFYCFSCDTTFTDFVKIGTKSVSCINGCDSENS